MIPPQNLEAEMAVIASVCLAPDMIDELGELKPEHFYADRHQRIWSAIQALSQRRVRADAVTLAEELDRLKQLEEIGGVEYLGKILETVPNAAHAKYYAAIVVSRWRSRQAKYGCAEVVQLINDGGTDDDVAQKAEAVLAEISERVSTAKDVAIGDVMAEAWTAINARIGRQEAAGTPTGFIDLDNLIVGIQPGELVVMAARPSMGKTAFAGCLMLSLARRGIGSLFISCEMSKLEISERLLCIDSHVSSTKLKAGTGLEEFELDALMQSASRVGALPIRIDDQPGQKVRAIAATARRVKRLHDIGFLVIDYLQLVEPNESKDVREQEVAGITKSLKGLAKELSIPVIVLAQLNRGVEMREDKRPRLGDLRESGAIEQDADKVLFLHRPAAYDPEDRPGEADVIVAKNRCGKIGTVALAWLAEFTEFRDLASAHYAAAEAASRAFAPNRQHEPKHNKFEDDETPRSSAGKSFSGNRDR